MPDQSGHCRTPSRILRMPELSQLLGISRSTIYEKMNPLSKYYDATFPRPVRLGSGSVGWRSSTIDEWLTLHTVPARSAVKGVNDEVRHTLSSDMTMSR
ncbi:AlpA family transcriptional regulator [Escherichia coli]|nr:AlpA family transcriptional regulator [Escherichia coli]EIK4295495.1 AlpA family transcriptional regulator [Escherichia coli]EKY2754502.1 AlpA family transcriptional regulator [Escherichia coli]ELO7365331.1 AlpA family transcriptional regulator [Escherichia coli]